MNLDFQKGLTENLGDLIRRTPKSDLHNHAALGGQLSDFRAFLGTDIPPPPPIMKGLREMDRYIYGHLRPLFQTRENFEFAIGAAFRQAKNDGIVRIEMSIDCWFVNHYPNRAEGLASFLKQSHQEYAPDVNWIPEMGFSRNFEAPGYQHCVEECLDSGFFRSIDLYGEELAEPPETYQYHFKKAKQQGMKCKAHAGEFGDADHVRKTAEVLELDAVQHGIASATSHEVMHWLAKNRIQLNVCPTSNVRLGVVKDLAHHPIRILFDHGIRVTLNTDDLMIFGASVSDEYFNLFQTGLFSAAELDQIRENGLR